MGLLGAWGVVFYTAIALVFMGAPVLAAIDFIDTEAGIDKNADGHWNFVFCDQVVENNGRAKVSVFTDVGVPVLEDHHGSGGVRLVLCRDVEIILAQGAFIDLAAEFVASYFTLWYSGLAL